MAKQSRRTAIKQLNDLKRIEDLLASTKQQDDPKEQLIQKAKQIQQERKEKEGSIPYLPYPHERVKINTIQISPHAYERIDQRFGVNKTDKDTVKKYVHQHLSSAKYIGIVSAEDGNKAHMFVEGRAVFMVNLELDSVRTVIKLENKIKCSVVHNKVSELIHKEFRKLDRKERATIRKLEEYKIDSAVEIAELKRRIHRSRSTAVKLSCKGRIKALEDGLLDLENNISEIQKLKRSVAYSYASVI